jgi:hypothetical protein
MDEYPKKKQVKLSKGLWSKKDLCDQKESLMYEPECYPNWITPSLKKGFKKITLKYKASFADPELTIDDGDQKACDILNDIGPSKTFLRLQELYNDNLSLAEKNGIFSYSYLGDELVNNYLRFDREDVIDALITQDKYEMTFKDFLEEDLTTSDLTDEHKEILVNQNIIDHKVILHLSTLGDFNRAAVHRAFKHAIDRLNNIVIKAPRNDQDMIVYRGVKDMSYLVNQEIVPILGF